MNTTLSRWALGVLVGVGALVGTYLWCITRGVHPTETTVLELIPPQPTARQESAPRTATVVLDISQSMGGFTHARSD